MTKTTKAEIAVLKKRIIVVKGALDPAICAGIIKHTKDMKEWVMATVGSGGREDHEVRNCHVLPLSEPALRASSEVIQEIDKVVFESAGKVMVEYVKKYPDTKEAITEDTGYELLRYKKGGFYHQHVDSFTREPRALSCSWAINDDYEGGEWGFFGGALNYKLAAGDAILFPSNSMYPHEINKVTKGTRYSIITWFR